MDLCLDLLKIVCSNLTDISTTRLLRTCKILQSLSCHICLKDIYDYIIRLDPNFKYRLIRPAYRNSLYKKGFVDNSTRYLYLEKVTKQIDKLPENLKVLHMVDCNINTIPLGLKTLIWFNLDIRKRFNFIDFREITCLELSNSIAITNFPPNLRKFRCASMYHYELPEFPPSLEFLSISRSILPTRNFLLPANLKALTLHNVSINNWGNGFTLPNSIEQLYISNIINTTINPPTNLKYLYCNHNFFDIKNCTSLKYIKLGSKCNKDIDYVPDSVEIVDIGQLNDSRGKLLSYPANLKKIITYEDDLPNHGNKYIVQTYDNEEYFFGL